MDVRIWTIKTDKLVIKSSLLPIRIVNILTLWQAAIAANMGEKDSTVFLLQEALEQGLNYSILYCKSWLEPLWDYPSLCEIDQIAGLTLIAALPFRLPK